MPTFNLVEEPWIPCMERAQDPPRLLSLRGVFTEARHLWHIADSSPAVTVSVYRLLLAILHRSLNGPKNAREWAALRQRGTLDLPEIHDYLTRWSKRFDLFDAEHPFFQVSHLDPGSAKPASQLTHERASDRNKPLLFDHTMPLSVLSPAEAACYLVAQQNFAVGGLVSYDSKHEPIANKYTSASPLLKAATCLVRGASVFETLLLNWHQYAHESEQPFPFTGDDQPAWERETATAPVERIPSGYVDLLTWQSRRILLIPETAETEHTVIRQVILMKGYQLPRSFEPWQAETMVPFRRNPKVKEGEAWSPVGLQPDRTIWRDSHALVRSVAGTQERPRMLDWVADLMISGALDEQRVLPLEVYGLLTDQAKILDWRRESLPLPLALIQSPEMSDTLKVAIDLAEETARFFLFDFVRLSATSKPLPSPMHVLATELLTGISERAPDPKLCRDLVQHFNATQDFWAHLDTPFRALVTALPQDVSVDRYGIPHYGQKTLIQWATHIAQAARTAFRTVITGLNGSARALRASALAEERFGYCLATLLAPYREQEKTEEVIA